MKRTTNWSERFEEVARYTTSLAEDVFEQVMKGVPHEVWGVVLQYSTNWPRFCCRVLTRVSKQLHRVTHENLSKLVINVSESDVTKQYPNLAKLFLSGSNTSLNLKGMTKLKCLVFSDHWKFQNLSRIYHEDFPSLVKLKFSSIPGSIYIQSELSKQITILHLPYYHHYFDAEFFPNLTKLVCYKVDTKIPFMSRLSCFGVSCFTDAAYDNLLDFKGIFIFQKVRYLVEEGFILKTNEAGKVERIDLRDESLPFDVRYLY